MNDKQLEELVVSLMNGSKSVGELSDEEFKDVVSGLARLYAARVFNCVDARGKNDSEWCMLSDVFRRIAKMNERNF